MRTLWIGLLTILARSLQAWSEAVTRRLEKVKHSASDQPSGEVDGPPAAWLERVKSAQPPTEWRAKVQPGRSDSIERAVIQGESTSADSPIEPQRPEEFAVGAPPLRSPVQPLTAVRPPSQPNYRPADATRPAMQAASDQSFASTHTLDQSPPPVHDRVVTPAKSAATRSPVKAVRPPHAPAREADLITPEVEATAPVDEVIAARSQPLASPRERWPVTPTQLIDDTRTHSTTSEHGGDDQTSTERFADAERDVPEPDISQRIVRSESQSASITQPAAPVDVMSAIESHAARSLQISSPTTPPHRSDFAMNDRVTASWPADNTLRSAQTWATIAGQSDAQYESSAIENRWPTLPPERITVDEDFETVLRERERLRRLDLEQRGLAWSA